MGIYFHANITKYLLRDAHLMPEGRGCKRRVCMWGRIQYRISEYTWVSKEVLLFNVIMTDSFHNLRKANSRESINIVRKGVSAPPPF